jgi:hypothetical protein
MITVYDRKLEVCRYITQICADINIRNANNDTTFNFAPSSNRVDTMKLLLDKEMCINLTNMCNTNRLHVSASGDNLEATTIFSTEVLT